MTALKSAKQSTPVCGEAYRARSYIGFGAGTGTFSDGWKVLSTLGRRSSTSPWICASFAVLDVKRLNMKRITHEVLRKMMENHEGFVLIDARTHEGYDEEHLPGAIRMPANRLGPEMVRGYKKDRTMVTYCSGWACESSTIAAQKLEKYGFTKVLDFKGGLEDWRKAGYDTVKS